MKHHPSCGTTYMEDCECEDMTNPPPAVEALKQRIRDSAPLLERLEQCRTRIGHMCSTLRSPRMSIPVEWSDDDVFICETIAEAIALLRQPEAAPSDAIFTDRTTLRRLVDTCWNECNEDTSAPSTKWADSIIDRVLAAAPQPAQECPASGLSCDMGPHGPKGATQCRYCGNQPTPEPGDDEAVAWRWLCEGKPEHYDLGGSLCWDGHGPSPDVERVAASAERPRTVQRLYTRPAPAAVKLPENVQRDAARYRWLRDEPSTHLYVRLKEKMTTSGMSVCSGPTLDYEIDKRIDAITPADEGGK